MLELLAGPFAIHDIESVDVSVSYNIGVSQPIMWDDDVGLMGFGDGSCDGYAVIQLDGLAWRRAKLSAYQFVPVFPERSFLVKADASRTLFTFDKKSGAIVELVLGTPVTGAINYVYYLGAQLPDRYLQILNNVVAWTPLDDPTSPATEHTFSGSLSGTPAISHTRYTHVVCLIWPDGSVAYYDWSLKTEVFSRQHLPANNGAWYSPRLGIFILLDTSNQINVYSTTVQPYALSDPSPFSPLLKGKKTNIEVILTGSNGETCPGEIIEWSMAGPGALTGTQSVTDSMGRADIGYIAPLTLSTDPTITATARF